MPQIQVDDIKHSSFLFKRHFLHEFDMTVLSDNKYLVKDMVIQDWHLVRKLHSPFGRTIRVPFQIGQSDFVIAGDTRGWHLVNLDDGTIQLLVKCIAESTGFSITTEEGKGFDLHFTSTK